MPFAIGFGPAVQFLSNDPGGTPLDLDITNLQAVDVTASSFRVTGLTTRNVPYFYLVLPQSHTGTPSVAEIQNGTHPGTAAFGTLTPTGGVIDFTVTGLIPSLPQQLPFTNGKSDFVVWVYQEDGAESDLEVVDACINEPPVVLSPPLNQNFGVPAGLALLPPLDQNFGVPASAAFVAPLNQNFGVPV